MIPKNQEINIENPKEIELNFINLTGMNAQIHPNPNSGIFTINIQNAEDAINNIKIINLLNECVFKTTTNNSQIFINLEFLPKGFYLAQIKNSKQSITKKIIIN